MIELGMQNVTFFGECESRKDPEKFGRIQVRCFGYHESNKSILPTELLPWAQVMLPTTSPDTTMSNIQPGTVVYGFFLDGEERQIPMVTHVLTGKISPSVMHYLGYTDKTLTGYADGRWRNEPSELLPLEPSDPYAAVYPFNHVMETESGHVIEVDDTENGERINVRHKTGSFIEIHPDGSIVKKSVANSHDVNAGDAYASSKNRTVYVSADYYIRVDGNAVVEVTGDSIEKVAGNKSIEVGGNLDIVAGGTITANGSLIKLN